MEDERTEQTTPPYRGGQEGRVDASGVVHGTISQHSRQHGRIQPCPRLCHHVCPFVLQFKCFTRKNSMHLCGGVVGCGARAHFQQQRHNNVTVQVNRTSDNNETRMTAQIGGCGRDRIVVGLL
jgi:hypothetical protein